jgi:hypothetical protein
MTTPLFKIAQLLGGAKKSGSGWMCLCPLHNDKNPSLKLDTARPQCNATVRKVLVTAIRDELKDRGFLEADEKGAIERVSRNHFARAKKHLLRREGFIQKGEYIWRQ